MKEADIKDLGLEDEFEPVNVPSPVGPVREAKKQIDLSLANPSCKDCYGTGVYGTLVQAGKRVKTKNGEIQGQETRTKLVCRCVGKAMAKQKQK